MPPTDVKELHRRSLVKSLLWRIIGIVWTWVGAYIILLFVPPSRQSAAFIATLIVIYHHSTRMLMYYGYERIWASIKWGRSETPRPMSRKEKILWSACTIAALVLIFFLLLEVHPKVKKKQSSGNGPPPVSETCEYAYFGISGMPERAGGGFRKHWTTHPIRATILRGGAPVRRRC